LLRFMVLWNGIIVLSPILLWSWLYVDSNELISKVSIHSMLSWLVYLHGIHSNGVGQGPSSDTRNKIYYGQ
jgi:hypothetical protein